MKSENISITEFIKILETFKDKGSVAFGMDISDNGKYIVLYPIKENSEEDEPDSPTSINNLKA